MPLLYRVLKELKVGTHFSSNYVRDLHQVVVDNVCEMIGWEAVRLEQNEILLDILLLKQTVNSVAELERAKIGAFETHDIRNALASPSVRVGRIDVSTCSGIGSGFPSLVKLPLLRLQLLGSAKATIGVTAVEQSLNVTLVGRKPLRLLQRRT